MTTVYNEGAGTAAVTLSNNGSLKDGNNSSTTLLDAGATFTGAWNSCIGFSTATISCFSDVDTAVGGLKIQFSQNGVDSDHTHEYTVLGGAGRTVETPVHAPYMRIVYVNGAAPQTVFRLSTIFDPNASSGTIVELGDVPTIDDDAQLTKSILIGHSNTTGDFTEVKTTQDGALLINQNILVDPANSSTTNVAMGATYVGGTTSNITASMIQIFLNTDQNCEVYLDQSQDGVNFDISDMFDFYAAIGNFGINVGAFGAYFRVRVKNIGVADTTYFRLQTIYVPIANQLPRTLDAAGKLQTAVYNTEDHNGFNASYSVNGETIGASLYRIVGGSFSGGVLDTNFWTASLGTGGTIATDGEITIHTGVTANNTVTLNSVRVARYTAGSANNFKTIVGIPDGGTANNTRRWGAFTTTNGAFFENNAGASRLATRKEGVTTYVENGTFNGHHGAWHLPGTTHHKYEIIWTSTKVMFMVDGHIIHTVNSSETPWTGSIHLPVRYENFNLNGSTTDVLMTVRHGFIHKIGIPQTQPTSKFIQGLNAGTILKYSPGNLHGMILSGITNNSVVTLYDNVAASGTVIWTSGPLVSNGLPFMLDMKGIPFSSGLTVAITGAKMNIMVMYE